MPPSTLRDGTGASHPRGQPAPTRLPASADFRRPGHSQKSALGGHWGGGRRACRLGPLSGRGGLLDACRCALLPQNRCTVTPNRCTITPKQMHRYPQTERFDLQAVPVSAFRQVRVQEELRGLVREVTVKRWHSHEAVGGASGPHRGAAGCPHSPVCAGPGGVDGACCGSAAPHPHVPWTASARPRSARSRHRRSEPCE